MTTQALIQVVQTRLAYCDGNPTKIKFYEELLEALRRLERYEKNDT